MFSQLQLDQRGAEEDAFFTLMSTSDYIRSVGHGTPREIWSNDMVLKFSVDDIGSVDLQQYHPVIEAYHPCYAGRLCESSSTLAYGFMNAGAAAYMGGRRLWASRATWQTISPMTSWEECELGLLSSSP